MSAGAVPPTGGCTDQLPAGLGIPRRPPDVERNRRSLLAAGATTAPELRAHRADRPTNRRNSHG